VTKVLTGAHAEDVGDGRVIEPGQEIPPDADPQTVARLQDEGKVTQTRSAPKSKED
jgi:hypothetical protein